MPMETTAMHRRRGTNHDVIDTGDSGNMSRGSSENISGTYAASSSGGSSDINFNENTKKMLRLTDTKTGKVIGVGIGVSGAIHYLTPQGVDLLGFTGFRSSDSQEHILFLGKYLALGSDVIEFKQMLRTLEQSSDSSTLLKLKSREFVWAEIVNAPTPLVRHFLFGLHKRHQETKRRCISEFLYDHEDFTNNGRCESVGGKGDRGPKITDASAVTLSSSRLDMLLLDEISNEANLRTESKLKISGNCSMYTDAASMIMHNDDSRSDLTGLILTRVDTGLGLEDEDTDTCDGNGKGGYDEGRVEFEGMSMFRDSNEDGDRTRDSRALSDTQSSTHTDTTADSAHCSDIGCIRSGFTTRPVNTCNQIDISQTDNDSASSSSSSSSSSNRSSGISDVNLYGKKDPIVDSRFAVRRSTPDTEYWSGSGSDRSNYSGRHTGTDTEEELNFEDVFEEYEEDPVHNVSESLKRVRIASDVPCADFVGQSSRRTKIPIAPMQLHARHTEPYLLNESETSADNGGWFVGSI